MKVLMKTIAHIGDYRITSGEKLHDKLNANESVEQT